MIEKDLIPYAPLTTNQADYIRQTIDAGRMLRKVFVWDRVEIRNYTTGIFPRWWVPVYV